MGREASLCPQEATKSSSALLNKQIFYVDLTCALYGPMCPLFPEHCGPFKKATGDFLYPGPFVLPVDDEESFPREAHEAHGPGTYEAAMKAKRDRAAAALTLTGVVASDATDAEETESDVEM
jgi:hypothetical protein